MDFENLIKEHYFSEINRKNQLTNALVIPIGVVTVLGSIIGFYVRNSNFQIGTITVIFILFLFISIFFLFRTIYYLIRSYHGYSYKYISTTLELKEYHIQLKKYYNETKKEVHKADQDFQQYVYDSYSVATQTNTWNNDSKSEYLHKANTALIYAFIFTIVCSVPYFIKHFSKIEKVQKIEIVNMQNFIKERKK